METKLKPCPFCGSEKLHYSKPTAYGTPAHWLSSVSCTECGAEVTGRDDKAIEAWNRRAEDKNVSKN